jgi:hypothetical protein
MKVLIHPIQNPLLLVTEPRTRDSMLSYIRHYYTNICLVTFLFEFTFCNHVKQVFRVHGMEFGIVVLVFGGRRYGRAEMCLEVWVISWNMSRGSGSCVC